MSSVPPVFQPRRPFRSARFLLFMSTLLLAACTRTAVPVDVPGYSGTSVAATELANIGTAAAMQAGEYAVAMMPVDEILAIHQTAGISGEIVSELPYNGNGIHLTSNQTTLGSSRWVEVESPDGVIGWVNFQNITEYIPHDLFCADNRVSGLISSFTSALLAQDGDALQATIHPRRGLNIRIDVWNPQVSLRAEQIPEVFVLDEVINWGGTEVTSFPIEGTFREIVSPMLMDVLAAEEKIVTCNQIIVGESGEGEWPEEYVNINYHAIYRPALEGEGVFDWRTWAVGIEYDGGVPYVAFLVQYRGD
ncbi:MAG: hypothetical protein JXA97_05185 [Anaerolineales bacterium]|nr:hypothetical protein [Anaerolineales bacterium]